MMTDLCNNSRSTGVSETAVVSQKSCISASPFYDQPPLSFHFLEDHAYGRPGNHGPRVSAEKSDNRRRFRVARRQSSESEGTGTSDVGTLNEAVREISSRPLSERGARRGRRRRRGSARSLGHDAERLVNAADCPLNSDVESSVIPLTRRRGRGSARSLGRDAECLVNSADCPLNSDVESSEIPLTVRNLEARADSEDMLANSTHLDTDVQPTVVAGDVLSHQSTSHDESVVHVDSLVRTDEELSQFVQPLEIMTSTNILPLNYGAGYCYVQGYDAAAYALQYGTLQGEPVLAMRMDPSWVLVPSNMFATSQTIERTDMSGQEGTSHRKTALYVRRVNKSNDESSAVHGTASAVTETIHSPRSPNSAIESHVAGFASSPSISQDQYRSPVRVADDPIGSSVRFQTVSMTSPSTGYQLAPMSQVAIVSGANHGYIPASHTGYDHRSQADCIPLLQSGCNLDAPVGYTSVLQAVSSPTSQSLQRIFVSSMSPRNDSQRIDFMKNLRLVSVQQKLPGARDLHARSTSNTMTDCDDESTMSGVQALLMLRSKVNEQEMSAKKSTSVKRVYRKASKTSETRPQDIHSQGFNPLPVVAKKRGRKRKLQQLPDSPRDDTRLSKVLSKRLSDGQKVDGLRAGTTVRDVTRPNVRSELNRTSRKFPVLISNGSPGRETMGFTSKSVRMNRRAVKSHVRGRKRNAMSLFSSRITRSYMRALESCMNERPNTTSTNDSHTDAIKLMSPSKKKQTEADFAANNLGKARQTKQISQSHGHMTSPERESNSFGQLPPGDITGSPLSESTSRRSKNAVPCINKRSKSEMGRANRDSFSSNAKSLTQGVRKVFEVRNSAFKQRGMLKVPSKELASRMQRMRNMRKCKALVEERKESIGSPKKGSKIVVNESSVKENSNENDPEIIFKHIEDKESIRSPMKGNRNFSSSNSAEKQSDESDPDISFKKVEKNSQAKRRISKKLRPSFSFHDFANSFHRRAASMDAASRIWISCNLKERQVPKVEPPEANSDSPVRMVRKLETTAQRVKTKVPFPSRNPTIAHKSLSRNNINSTNPSSDHTSAVSHNPSCSELASLGSLAQLSGQTSPARRYRSPLRGLAGYRNCLLKAAEGSTVSRNLSNFDKSPSRTLRDLSEKPITYSQGPSNVLDDTSQLFPDMTALAGESSPTTIAPCSASPIRLTPNSRRLLSMCKSAYVRLVQLPLPSEFLRVSETVKKDSAHAAQMYNRSNSCARQGADMAAIRKRLSSSEEGDYPDAELDESPVNSSSRLIRNVSAKSPAISRYSKVVSSSLTKKYRAANPSSKQNRENDKSVNCSPIRRKQEAHGRAVEETRGSTVEEVQDQVVEKVQMRGAKEFHENEKMQDKIVGEIQGEVANVVPENVSKDVQDKIVEEVQNKIVEEVQNKIVEEVQVPMVRDRLEGPAREMQQQEVESATNTTVFPSNVNSSSSSNRIKSQTNRSNCAFLYRFNPKSLPSVLAKAESTTDDISVSVSGESDRGECSNARNDSLVGSITVNPRQKGNLVDSATLTDFVDASIAAEKSVPTLYVEAAGSAATSTDKESNVTTSGKSPRLLREPMYEDISDCETDSSPNSRVRRMTASSVSHGLSSAKLADLYEVSKMLRAKSVSRLNSERNVDSFAVPYALVPSSEHLLYSAEGSFSPMTSFGLLPGAADNIIASVACVEEEIVDDSYEFGDSRLPLFSLVNSSKNFELDIHPEGSGMRSESREEVHCYGDDLSLSGQQQAQSGLILSNEQRTDVSVFTATQAGDSAGAKQTIASDTQVTRKTRSNILKASASQEAEIQSPSGDASLIGELVLERSGASRSDQPVEMHAETRASGHIGSAYTDENPDAGEQVSVKAKADEASGQSRNDSPFDLNDSLSEIVLHLSDDDDGSLSSAQRNVVHSECDCLSQIGVSDDDEDRSVVDLRDAESNSVIVDDTRGTEVDANVIVTGEVLLGSIISSSDSIGQEIGAVQGGDLRYQKDKPQTFIVPSSSRSDNAEIETRDQSIAWEDWAASLSDANMADSSTIETLVVTVQSNQPGLTKDVHIDSVATVELVEHADTFLSSQPSPAVRLRATRARQRQIQNKWTDPEGDQSLVVSLLSDVDNVVNDNGNESYDADHLVVSMSDAGITRRSSEAVQKTSALNLLSAAMSKASDLSSVKRRLSSRTTATGRTAITRNVFDTFKSENPGIIKEDFDSTICVPSENDLVQMDKQNSSPGCIDESESSTSNRRTRRSLPLSSDNSPVKSCNNSDGPRRIGSVEVISVKRRKNKDSDLPAKGDDGSLHSQSLPVMNSPGNSLGNSLCNQRDKKHASTKENARQAKTAARKQANKNVDVRPRREKVDRRCVPFSPVRTVGRSSSVASDVSGPGVVGVEQKELNSHRTANSTEDLHLSASVNRSHDLQLVVVSLKVPPMDNPGSQTCKACHVGIVTKCLAAPPSTQRVYQCVFCTYANARLSEVTSHIATHHRDLMFALSHQTKVSREPWLCRYHLCRHCDFVAVDSVLVWIHFELYHGVTGILYPTDDETGLDPAADWMKRVLCLKSLADEMLPLDLAVYNEKVYVCINCNLWSADKAVVVYHILAKCQHRAVGGSANLTNGFFVKVFELRSPKSLRALSRSTGSDLTYMQLYIDPVYAGQRSECFVCTACLLVIHTSGLALSHYLAAHQRKKLVYACARDGCAEVLDGEAELSRHETDGHGGEGQGRRVSTGGPARVCSMSLVEPEEADGGRLVECTMSANG